MQNFLLTLDKIKENTDFWLNNSQDSYVDVLNKTIKWGCENFEGKCFYIFQFIKRVDDGSGIKKMYHQPRLTRPEPVGGTTLIRVDPKNPEQMKIVWTLPNRENFEMYRYQRAFADPFVYDCIQTYKYRREEMLRAEIGDADEREAREIYARIKEKSRRRQVEKTSAIAC